MTTDNTETLLKLAWSLRDEKAKKEKKLLGNHWTYLTAGIRRAADKEGIKLKDLNDDDKAHFVLEAGDEALVGIYRRIGPATAKKLFKEAMNHLAEKHDKEIEGLLE